MKKLFSLVIVLSFVLASQAKVWRVNNIAAMNADFTSFVAAQASVSSNDTLYFEGSTLSYGDITLSIPLVIIGPGYFLNQNPQTQNSLLSASFDKVIFNSGSLGSELTGVAVNGSITINANNIIIMKCLCLSYSEIILNSTAASIGNIFILKNYLYSVSSSGSNPIHNLLISNNFIDNNNFNDCISLGKNTSGEIKNNTLNGDLNVYNFKVYNNIHLKGSISMNNNYFYNNICYYAPFPSGNGNQQSINMTDVFVGATGNSTDGQWQLKTFSPALKAGNDSTDCGMFGGTSPYVLSGLPSIPSIYEITIPTTGDNINGINVTIKAKTHE